MTETIAILFIFFVLIVFGIIFYYQYQKVALEDKKEELLASRAIDTTIRALYMPELICTKGDAEPEDNCLDMMKLRYADQIFKENINEYYYHIFSFAKVTVVQLYPQEFEIVLYDKEKIKVLDSGEVVPNWENIEPTYYVITLKDEIFDGRPHYGYGYFKVEVYS